MQGRRQKHFQGATEKRPKNYKKRPKNSTIMPLPGGAMKKDRKMAKKDRKISLLSLYLHVFFYNMNV